MMWKTALWKSPIRLSRGDFPLYPIPTNNALVLAVARVSGPESHGLPNKLTGSSFHGRATFR